MKKIIFCKLVFLFCNVDCINLMFSPAKNNKAEQNLYLFNNFSGTPYWSQGAEKQYYVTKKCSNRTHCEDRRKQFVHHCHHIWYEDWKCAECCQGDRCNYYVIVSS